MSEEVLQKAQGLGLDRGKVAGLLQRFGPQVLELILSLLQGGGTGGTAPAGAQASYGDRTDTLQEVLRLQIEAVRLTARTLADQGDEGFAPPSQPEPAQPEPAKK